MAAKDETEKPEKQETSAILPEPRPADVQASVDYVCNFCKGLSPRDQHNAFAYQLASKGWSFGVTVDADGKRHPWACDWLQLPKAARAQQHVLFNSNIIEE